MTRNQVLRDALSMIACNPVNATWSGTEYEGTVSGIDNTQPLEDGGYMPSPRLKWFTTYDKESAGGSYISRFSGDTAPDVADVLTIASVGYRILGRSIDEWGVGIEYDLISDDE